MSKHRQLATTTADCLGWITELEVKYGAWVLISTTEPMLGYPDARIPFKPGAQETTDEYQTLCNSQIAEHNRRVAATLAEVNALKERISDAAESLMEAAARRDIDVDYSRFRELVDGWNLMNPQACTAAKNNLDLLQRRLNQIAKYEEIGERAARQAEIDMANGLFDTPKKPRGRPAMTANNERRRLDVLEKWYRAKGRVSQAEFCDDEKISVKYLNTCVNWQTQRRRRNER